MNNTLLIFVLLIYLQVLELDCDYSPGKRLAYIVTMILLVGVICSNIYSWFVN